MNKNLQPWVATHFKCIAPLICNLAQHACHCLQASLHCLQCHNHCLPRRSTTWRNTCSSCKQILKMREITFQFWDLLEWNVFIWKYVQCRGNSSSKISEAASQTTLLTNSEGWRLVHISTSQMTTIPWFNVRSMVHETQFTSQSTAEAATINWRRVSKEIAPVRCCRYCGKGACASCGQATMNIEHVRCSARTPLIWKLFACQSHIYYLEAFTLKSEKKQFHRLCCWPIARADHWCPYPYPSVKWQPSHDSMFEA